MMNVLKMTKKLFVACAVLLCLFVPFSTDVKANAEYEIVFKAGAHGTIEDKSSVSYRVQAGELFPNDPAVVAEEGYVFTGWNKELPSVGSTVDRKLVYVAKYDIVIDGISYIVHYVDEDNVPIATPKTMMSESGSKVVERAKNVPGYTYEEAQKEVTIDSKTNKITFVYKLTNPELVVRYEEEITNVTGANGTGNNNNTIGNANNPNNDNGRPTQKEVENVNNQDNPLAKGNGIMGDSTILYVMGGAILIVLGAILWMYLKLRKQHKDN